MSGDIFWLSQWCWECQWHLMCRGQGCYKTSHNARRGPHNMFEIHMMPRLKNLGLREHELIIWKIYLCGPSQSLVMQEKEEGSQSTTASYLSSTPVEVLLISFDLHSNLMRWLRGIAQIPLQRQGSWETEGQTVSIDGQMPWLLSCACCT
jgi:hypothetical protein